MHERTVRECHEKLNVGLDAENSTFGREPASLAAGASRFLSPGSELPVRLRW